MSGAINDLRKCLINESSVNEGVTMRARGKDFAAVNSVTMPVVHFEYIRFLLKKLIV